MSDFVFPETRGLFGKSLELVLIQPITLEQKEGPSKISRLTLGLIAMMRIFFVIALSYHSVGNKQVPETKRIQVRIGLKLEDATVVFAECSCKPGKGGLCSHTLSVMTTDLKIDNLDRVSIPTKIVATFDVEHQILGTTYGV